MGEGEVVWGLVVFLSTEETSRVFQVLVHLGCTGICSIIKDLYSLILVGAL